MIGALFGDGPAGAPLSGLAGGAAGCACAGSPAAAGVRCRGGLPGFLAAPVLPRGARSSGASAASAVASGTGATAGAGGAARGASSAGAGARGAERTAGGGTATAGGCAAAGSTEGGAGARPGRSTTRIRIAAAAAMVAATPIAIGARERPPATVVTCASPVASRSVLLLVAAGRGAPARPEAGRAGTRADGCPAASSGNILVRPPSPVRGAATPAPPPSPAPA